MQASKKGKEEEKKRKRAAKLKTEIMMTFA
jgi:hypothetical protein